LGLKETTESIWKTLHDDECLVITGPRRIGKTRLLRQLLRESPEKDRPLGVWTSFDLADHEPGALLETITTWLHRRLKELKQDPSIDELLKPRLTEGLLEAIRITERAPVICLDHFERLLGAPDVDAALFDTLGKLKEQVSFVVACLPSTWERLRRAFPSPFFENGGRKSLGALPDETARELLTRPFRDLGMEEPQEPLVDQIIEWSGAHPYLLRQAGNYLFEKVGNWSVDDEALQEVVALARDELEPKMPDRQGFVRLAYVMVLAHPDLVDLLDGFRAGTFFEALERFGRSLSRPEQLERAQETLDKRRGDVEPNPLWSAYVQATRFRALDELKEQLGEDLFFD